MNTVKLRQDIAANIPIIKADLGDRTKYVGSSDLSCSRKGILNKRFPPKHTLRTQMKFRRGDIVEDMVAQSLRQAGYNIQHGFEAIHPNKPYLIAHADIYFPLGDDRAFILECKSTEHMPDAAYESWVHQVTYQIGLTLLANPHLKEVTAAVYVMDIISGEEKIFDGFNHSPIIFDFLVKKADGMWRLINEQKITQADPRGYFIPTHSSVLCEYCPFRFDCPALILKTEVGCIDLEPIMAAAENYIDASAAQSVIKKDREKSRSEIMEYMQDYRYGRLGDMLFEIKKSERLSLDNKKLKEECPEIVEKYTKAKEVSRLTVKDRPQVLAQLAS